MNSKRILFILKIVSVSLNFDIYERARVQRGGTGGPDTPTPEKSQSYQVSIQCWATMAFRWRAEEGPLIVVFLISKKKLVKVGPPLTKLSGSAHVIVF